jgi:homopolymeric O-antigen transport system permease protein
MADVSPTLSALASTVEEDFDVTLEPTRGFRSLELRELVAFRELLYFLTWRDLKVRYKQTIIGIGWAILQPVLAMIVFTIIFGHVAQVSTNGVPYPIFSYAALLPWYFFATSVQFGSNSLVSSSQLITKVYFPRILVVVAPVAGALVDLLLAACVLAGLMVYYGIAPGIGIVILPAFMLLAILAAVGVSALLSALNVRYRDVRFAVPFLMQIWFFATPVVYEIAAVHEPWRTLFGLNPMTAVVLAFRWACAGGAAPDSSVVLLSVASTIVIAIAGLAYFGRTEKTFADLI